MTPGRKLQALYADAGQLEDAIGELRELLVSILAASTATSDVAASDVVLLGRLARLDARSGRARRSTDWLLWFLQLDALADDDTAKARQDVRTWYDSAYDRHKAEGSP